MDARKSRHSVQDRQFRTQKAERSTKLASDVLRVLVGGSSQHYIGTEYGVAVCSGTAALETALYALDIRKGDEIIMPSFTIISCAIAALRLGAKPVLVDIDPETWNIDVNCVESKITKKTQATMPVHIYGYPVNRPCFSSQQEFIERLSRASSVSTYVMWPKL